MALLITFPDILTMLVSCAK